MEPILTPQEASDLDRGAQARGVSAADLMERAGRAVANATIEVAGGVYGRRAVVVCGKGNNGGDGFVAARHLARRGMRVDVVAVGAADDDCGPASTNRDRLGEEGLVATPWEATRAGRALARADVAVDALFGTGFHGEPEGAWQDAIDAIDASPAPVVAVDIPSGVDGATGAVLGSAVWAHLTVAFGAAKLGSVLLPGAERAGTVRVVDIGFPDDLVRPRIGLTERADVAAMLPTRELQGHKRSSGVLLVVAGSRSMTGAPALIARAAGRVGAGLVIVATPRDALPAVAAHVAEAVFLPLAQTDAGTIGAGALDAVLDAAEGADAVAIGPGLSRDDETARLVRDLVARCTTPIVLDADGLNAFEGDVDRLGRRAADTVVTPHDGEFERLMLRSASEMPDRVSAALALADASHAVALLKGARTVVADPDGRARVNPTGTPALATAGTGDVLTGMIGGLLARGLSGLEAATAGAFVHGLAGRRAGATLGEGALAGDVIERIPEAVGSVLA
ncbi:MAG TPA: NAD(P)H-hydrate dehydratase [Actinomycetota bacterium]|nr:NAD(P)H-hydrate dehydratase [Actinomycetota bacterium]